MSFSLTEVRFADVVEVTDYVANGSFASLKANVTYKTEPDFAVLARLVDHNANWKGDRVYVDENAYKFLSKSSLVAGDVVIANVGANAGTVFQIPKLGVPVTLGPNAVRVRPKGSDLDRDFLYYYISSPLGQDKLQSIITGSAQPKFNKTALRGLVIRLPNVGYQRQTVEVVKTLDDRITLLRETNATLEAIAQALFKSWFVDFDPVHAKSQGVAPAGMDEATAALFPDSFEESALGLVPKGWRTCSMIDVSTVGIGKTPPRKESQWFSKSRSDIRWVSIRDMGAAGAFAFETSEYLTSEAIDRFNVRLVPDNTVLLSFKMTIGRVAITDGEMTTNEAIAHFKLNEASPATTEYIYLSLKAFDFSSLSSTSSIADAVNSKTVRELPLVVPSAVVLRAFQNVVGPIFQRMKVIGKQAQTLATLRDTLLPRLISGQLRLPEAEAIVEAH
jgi:type I restriction enzyme S subunit